MLGLNSWLDFFCHQWLCRQNSKVSPKIPAPLLYACVWFLPLSVRQMMNIMGHLSWVALLINWFWVHRGGDYGWAWPNQVSTSCWSGRKPTAMLGTAQGPNGQEPWVASGSWAGSLAENSALQPQGTEFFQWIWKKTLSLKWELQPQAVTLISVWWVPQDQTQPTCTWVKFVLLK